jgi:hypothetical protein
MTKILVVGLAVILAAAGSARADGTNGKGDQSSAPSATTGSSDSSGSARSSGSQGAVAPARSSGSGAVQQGAVAPSNRSGAAPVARPYPTNVNVQKGVQPNLPANWRVQRPLDRSELLTRQAMYYRSRVNPTTGQATNPSTPNAGQVRNGGQVSTDASRQGIIQKRHHRDGENNSQKTTGATNGTPETNTKPIPAANAGLRGGKPVLNFNNANTMNFSDACRRHRDRHDRDWWRNHCHTIILIGSGFYAWDLGYWYPAYGYDSYYSNYAYDGPIYGYDGLPPDQVIANVQYALQQLGYFAEAVDGVLGPVTRAAIEDYQVENNLPVTGAIDRPLLVSLGFIY